MVKIKSIVYLLTVLVLSFTTRLYDVINPPFTVWDEVHFGKFINYYMNRTMHFDVHPPGGKILLTAMAYLTGYDGQFSFSKGGMNYETSKYEGIRKICASCGALSICFIFAYVLLITESNTAAFISSLFLIFDHSNLIISRYILLDSILLLFTSLVLFLYTVSEFKNSFLWYILCGINFGFLVSVKICGVFTLLFLFICKSRYFINIFYDLEKTHIYLIMLALKTVIGCIMVPLITYVFIYLIYFSILLNFGHESCFFSIPFQISLLNNPYNKLSFSEYIGNESIVVFKGYALNTNYLHSHDHKYPDNYTNMQQVTGYGNMDENSHWYIRKYKLEKLNNMDWIIRTGDLVTLHHVNTKRILGINREKSTISDKAFKVICQNASEFDVNNLWILKDDKDINGSMIFPFKSKLRILHLKTGCELMDSGETLPCWAFNQNEIICNNYKNHERSIWMIVSNKHKYIPTKRTSDIEKLKFTDKLIDLHKIMFKINNKLVPKLYEISSRPIEWLLNMKGQQFSALKNHRIYLLGNPLLFWLIFATFPLYIFTGLLHYSCSAGRINMSVKSRELISKVFFNSSLFLTGWIIHYIPYFFMRRVLYFHHYMPAYIYYSMFSGTLLEGIFRYLTSLTTKDRVARKICMNIIMSLIFGIMLFSFNEYSFMVYGIHGSSKSSSYSIYNERKILKSWDF